MISTMKMLQYQQGLPTWCRMCLVKWAPQSPWDSVGIFQVAKIRLSRSILVTAMVVALTSENTYG